MKLGLCSKGATAPNPLFGTRVGSDGPGVSNGQKSNWNDQYTPSAQALGDSSPETKLENFGQVAATVATAAVAPVGILSGMLPPEVSSALASGADFNQTLSAAKSGHILSLQQVALGMTGLIGTVAVVDNLRHGKLVSFPAGQQGQIVRTWAAVSGLLSGTAHAVNLAALGQLVAGLPGTVVGGVLGAVLGWEGGHRAVSLLAQECWRPTAR